MSKQIIQGIGAGLAAIVICVTIGSFAAQWSVEGHEGHEEGHGEAGAAEHPSSGETDEAVDDNSAASDQPKDDQTKGDQPEGDQTE